MLAPTTVCRMTHTSFLCRGLYAVFSFKTFFRMKPWQKYGPMSSHRFPSVRCTASTTWLELSPFSSVCDMNCRPKLDLLFLTQSIQRQKNTSMRTSGSGMTSKRASKVAFPSRAVFWHRSPFSNGMVLILWLNLAVSREAVNVNSFSTRPSYVHWMGSPVVAFSRTGNSRDTSSLNTYAALQLKCCIVCDAAHSMERLIRVSKGRLKCLVYVLKLLPSRRMMNALSSGMRCSHSLSSCLILCTTGDSVSGPVPVRRRQTCPSLLMAACVRVSTSTHCDQLFARDAPAGSKHRQRHRQQRQRRGDGGGRAKQRPWERA
mmetsp:Transcript_1930/g.4444  ORF Transcript_1930/g.4444 Transcript_1930/m.4444 type:complete len:317 (+) Transcript_1930:256-1206(+)